MLRAANITIGLLYNELRQVHREVHELREVIVPSVRVSPKERGELDAIYKEMSEGKATPWREALKK